MPLALQLAVINYLNKKNGGCKDRFFVADRVCFRVPLGSILTL
jgi:hypothetical protein